jgi:hypothetical protein
MSCRLMGSRLGVDRLGVCEGYCSCDWANEKERLGYRRFLVNICIRRGPN